MMGIRDRIVHQYFKVDLDVIWQTVTSDIPELETLIAPIYDKLASYQ